MEDNEFPEVEGAAQSVSAAPELTSGSGHYSSVHREQIVDRTGELLESAINVAENHLRSAAGQMQDPRDGTVAHFQFGQNGLSVVPAESFDGYRKFPIARTGTATLTQLSSFIALVNRFKDEKLSAIFACDSMGIPTRSDPLGQCGPSLTAIFDYHPANEDADTHPAAQNRRHKAHYAFPLSVEWQAWFGKNEKAMSMAEFASFLETHIVDVSDDAVTAWSEQAQAFAKANRATTPEAIATPTRLVDLSLKFRIYETAESCEAVNLTSGETQLTFVSEHKQADGKPVDFPKLFSIVIPIFARSPIFYRIIARLRYRLANGKPVFWFELWRPDLTFETAFNEALEQVEEETGLPIFAGSPEV
jgi:hypothetical protein